MRKVSVSSTLTLYHDGQFWVGVAERVEDGRLSVAKTVFGAEPSDAEVLQFICERWAKLQFTTANIEVAAPRQFANPKRRAREAARALKQRGISTKAQLAMSKERELRKREAKSARSQRRQKDKDRKFTLRTEKRKRKHRGK